MEALHLTELQGLSKQRPIDIAIVAVKSYDTEWATTMVRQYLAETGYVISLQNCINEERIAGIVGWGRTVGCIAAQLAAELYAPGRIRRTVAKGGGAHAHVPAGRGAWPADPAHRGRFGAMLGRGRQRARHHEPVGRAVVQAVRQIPCATASPR